MISLFLIEYNHQYISDLIFWRIQALHSVTSPWLIYSYRTIYSWRPNLTHTAHISLQFHNTPEIAKSEVPSCYFRLCILHTKTPVDRCRLFTLSLRGLMYMTSLSTKLPYHATMTMSSNTYQRLFHIITLGWAKE